MPELEIRPHPGRKRNEITGLLEPFIRDLDALYLDGRLIAYCGAAGYPNRPITCIRPFGISERAAIRQFVIDAGRSPSHVVCPPPPTPERLHDLYLGDEEL